MWLRVHGKHLEGCTEIIEWWDWSGAPDSLHFMLLLHCFSFVKTCFNVTLKEKQESNLKKDSFETDLIWYWDSIEEYHFVGYNNNIVILFLFLKILHCSGHTVNYFWVKWREPWDLTVRWAVRQVAAWSLSLFRAVVEGVYAWHHGKVELMLLEVTFHQNLPVIGSLFYPLKVAVLCFPLLCSCAEPQDRKPPWLP